MKVEISDFVVTIAFVVLLIVGSVSAFFVYDTWTKLNPDEREESHEYALSGTLDGEECTGRGEMNFLAHRAGCRVYTVEISAVSTNLHMETTFSLIFDSEDKLDSTLYTLVGEEHLDDKTIGIWKHSENGVDYTLYVSEFCTVESMDLVSPGYRLTGIIV